MIAVIRLLMPADALNSEIKIATSAPTPMVERPRAVRVPTWSMINFWASGGSVLVTARSCSVIAAASAKNP